MSQLTQAVVASIREKMPDLGRAALGPEYSYHSLPLCLIDAVFSIGVRYANARKAVEAWCRAQQPNWPLFSSDDGSPARTISDFLRVADGIDGDTLASKFFGGNRQRTSSKNGILKAEATVRFARGLHEAGIENFQQMKDDSRIKWAWHTIRDIPGQGSRLSFDYLLMLAGDDSSIKADRMVCRFVADAAGLPAVSPPVARAAVLEASRALGAEFPNVTPRLLDHLIWSYQRNRPGIGL